jgi:hypothetical protein
MMVLCWVSLCARVGPGGFGIGFQSVRDGVTSFFALLLLLLLQDRSAVFTGTFGALAIMTVISVALGQVSTAFFSTNSRTWV